MTSDQDEYAKTMRAMSHEELSTNKLVDSTGNSSHSVYRSFVRPIAYLLRARLDTVVCVPALQRWNHAPKIIHVKRLNALT